MRHAPHHCCFAAVHAPRLMMRTSACSGGSGEEGPVSAMMKHGLLNDEGVESRERKQQKTLSLEEAAALDKQERAVKILARWWRRACKPATTYRLITEHFKQSATIEHVKSIRCTSISCYHRMCVLYHHSHTCQIRLCGPRRCAVAAAASSHVYYLSSSLTHLPNVPHRC